MADELDDREMVRRQNLQSFLQTYFIQVTDHTAYSIQHLILEQIGVIECIVGDIGV